MVCDEGWQMERVAGKIYVKGQSIADAIKSTNKVALEYSGVKNACGLLTIARAEIVEYHSTFDAPDDRTVVIYKLRIDFIFDEKRIPGTVAIQLVPVQNLYQYAIHLTSTKNLRAQLLEEKEM
jgi:hypothetical protein